MTTKNSFDSKAFFSDAFYAPLTMGKHSVTLGNVTAVVEETDNGPEYYIVAPTVFENGRKIDIRFYSFGARIFCDQVRRQTENTADYATLQDYLDVISNTTLDVWLSKRVYEQNGVIKTTIQYDFIEPTVETEPDANKAPAIIEVET